MTKYLYGDPMKCTGCRICEVVCSFNKEEVINPNLARLKVERFENGEDKVHTCRQCQNAPCMEACPENAIYKENGIVKIDESVCQGHFECQEACPFDMIVRIADKGTAGKCDLCGECIRFCPPDALWIEDTEEVAKRKRNSELTEGGDGR